jgi:hypothetical protein
LIASYAPPPVAAIEDLPVIEEENADRLLRTLRRFFRVPQFRHEQQEVSSGGWGYMKAVLERTTPPSA